MFQGEVTLVMENKYYMYNADCRKVTVLLTNVLSSVDDSMNLIYYSIQFLKPLRLVLSS